MNFQTTSDLLEVIKPYTENAMISVTSEGGNFESNLVTIDGKNHVGFEVLDNEIIAFYYTDHYHFEDYSSDLEAGEDDYIKRAKDFLIQLFENQIKYVEVYKGKKLAAEKYYIIYSDNTEERIGATWWGLERFFNPFAKRLEKVTIYRFDKENGCFI